MSNQTKNSTHRTAVIILAGGSSSRLGKPKQLLHYQHQTLIKHVVKTASQSGVEPVIVVTGFLNDELVRELKDESVLLIHNPEWKEGMGSSIRTGINGLKQLDDQIDGVLILLCDQPLITTEHLHLLTSKFYADKRSMITATGYAETSGVPAIFDKGLFTLLETLPSETGAQWIFKKYREQLTVVPFESASIDVDTEEDYLRLIKLSKDNQD